MGAGSKGSEGRLAAVVRSSDCCHLCYDGDDGCDVNSLANRAHPCQHNTKSNRSDNHHEDKEYQSLIFESTRESQK